MLRSRSILWVGGLPRGKNWADLVGEEMDFGSGCKRGGEVVCRDWGCGNGRGVISGGVNK